MSALIGGIVMLDLKGGQGEAGGLGETGVSRGREGEEGEDGGQKRGWRRS